MSTVARLIGLLMATLVMLCWISVLIFFIVVGSVFIASAFLQEAIDTGEKVVIETKLKDSKGKFGRVLGNVMVDGININQALVDNYLAVAYFGQSKTDIEDEHLTNRAKLIELGKFVAVD